jgi:hypothetical protein
MQYSEEQVRMFRLHLRGLDLGVESDNPLLYTLDSAIRDSVRRIEEAEEPDDRPEYIWLIDDECDQIEDHLGLSFVTCQVSITNVVSHCKRLHEFHERQTGIREIASYKDVRQDLLQRCSAPVGDTLHTAITAIEAFANYFKHRDEWGVDWSLLNRNALPTAKVIQSLGAQSGSTGNLRRGFEGILGNHDYHQVLKLGALVSDWAAALKAEYKNELLRPDKP